MRLAFFSIFLDPHGLFCQSCRSQADLSVDFNLVVDSFGAFGVVEAYADEFSEPLAGIGHDKVFGNGGAGLQMGDGAFEVVEVG